MVQVTRSHKVRTLSLNRGVGFIGRHNLWFLNIAQFFGALNDNLFKFLTIYLLIDLKGIEASSDILFLIGIAFVLPFLLFSSVAGVLADRFSKQKVIVLLKALEVVIIIVGFVAYAYKIPWLCYSLVFALSMQSALMAPSKYGIIPELVRKEQIPKANGLITAFTYLAIIFGTVLASAMTQVTGRNFLLAISGCFLVAVVGFFASLYIPHTEAERNKQKISLMILPQIYKTLKYCKRTPRLVLAVFGSAYFMFIGGFVQLNIIPFSMQFLGLSEECGGYLFSVMAIGIAMGSACAGRACKREVDLGLACFGLLGIPLLLFIFPLFATHLLSTIVILTALGFFWGSFCCPL